MYKKAIIGTAYQMSNSSTTGASFQFDYATLSEDSNSVKNKLGDTFLNITERILRREFNPEEYLTAEEKERVSRRSRIRLHWCYDAK